MRDGSINEILYADDSVLIGEIMKDLRDKFWRWKEAFKGKAMRVNLYRTNMIVSGLEEKVTASKLDPCGEWCMRKEGKSQRSLLYKLREVGSRKGHIHEKGHSWHGQEFCSLIMYNFR